MSKLSVVYTFQDLRITRILARIQPISPAPHPAPYKDSIANGFI